MKLSFQKICNSAIISGAQKICNCKQIFTFDKALLRLSGAKCLSLKGGGFGRGELRERIGEGESSPLPTVAVRPFKKRAGGIREP